MSEAPRFAVREVVLYERPVELRLPFETKQLGGD